MKIKALEQQPTRPIGKWIDVGVEGLVFKCSLCGDKNMIESHFCPNCGARMAESEKEEPILDKIRAEIEQKCCITVGSEDEPAITLYDVFQIIDKYRTESEE